ncbi:hypothetical protein C3Y87_05835 [Carbonactinospora thermoautotrophica]|uniref:zinc ribbon domain-containing protein n=1 Tax=Carbonactinospora thermoautotrophica TaxID=1469144 RepID=UPI000829E64E|nr:C4-type zinc ribbon domain-containing protein [Carbonactinospora thermoautotrophica]MCX9190939.1 hypothetical protein [Carbonactinospora thermoautotrophica]
MNAAPADQIRLLDLQGIDSRLDQLAHRRRNLPELAEIAELDGKLAKLRDRIVAAETEEGDIAREQAKAEADVEAVRARARRDQERLDSGSITSAKELTSLQHEIESLKKRQSDLEDTVLEIMDRREQVQRRIAELKAEQAEAEAARKAAEQRRDTAFAEIDAQAATLREQREQVAAAIPGDLLALYEKLRQQFGGVGAAALRQRRCEGCREELSLVELNTIRQAPPDQVFRCESCRRILVRTEEAGL